MTGAAALFRGAAAFLVAARLRGAATTGSGDASGLRLRCRDVDDGRNGGFRKQLAVLRGLFVDLCVVASRPDVEATASTAAATTTTSGSRCARFLARIGAIAVHVPRFVEIVDIGDACRCAALEYLRQYRFGSCLCRLAVLRSGVGAWFGHSVPG